jgi:hypothetical protein
MKRLKGTDYELKVKRHGLQIRTSVGEGMNNLKTAGITNPHQRGGRNRIINGV